jgi:hypothetical protein
LTKEDFSTRLQNDIESATARLIEEGRRDIASRSR